MTPAFFGYGSLVNTRTHSYPAPTPTTLPGWRRVWRQTVLRDVAFLSVEPAQGAEIQGLTAQVPDADWVALDAREHGYQRQDITDTLNATRPTALYLVEERHFSDSDGVILQSYLDVVVQGYLHQFGEAGVAAFFATTAGWDIPIRNDRDDPRYPRAQVLTPEETALVDSHIAAL